MPRTTAAPNFVILDLLADDMPNVLQKSEQVSRFAQVANLLQSRVSFGEFDINSFLVLPLPLQLYDTLHVVHLLCV